MTHPITGKPETQAEREARISAGVAGLARIKAERKAARPVPATNAIPRGYRLVRSMLMFPAMNVRQGAIVLSGAPERVGTDQRLDIATPGKRPLMHAITPNGHRWGYVDHDEIAPF